MVMGELDPAYQDSLFPDICLEQPELQSIMGHQVSQEVQNRILTAVRQTHDNNLEKMQLWDSKVRSLYSAASSLVNDRVETLRGYRRIQTALDVCLQSIMRRAGPFYKPPSSTSTSKPGKDKGSSCVVASTYKVDQKRRSKGKGRLIMGLSPHPTPPPVSVMPK